MRCSDSKNTKTPIIQTPKGILMYDLYCGGRGPYPGRTPSDIAAAVCRDGLRPAFPRGTPADYARLASDCWAADPAARPSMAEVVARLDALHGCWAVCCGGAAAP